MGIVTDFQRQLDQKAKRPFATWRRIDLHNHSPASFDYKGDQATAIEDSAQQIVATDLDIVMFTDHEVLPTAEFASEVAERSGRLVLRGVELNFFVDAWDLAEDKVSKNLFFHLLVGFDPDGDQTPEYWLDHIYRTCETERRSSGNREILGIKSSLNQFYDVVEEAGAITIPAHLHSKPDAFKSRSIDDIYTDSVFLSHARNHFTALEVTSPRTAAFFRWRTRAGQQYNQGLHKV